MKAKGLLKFIFIVLMSFAISVSITAQETPAEPTPAPEIKVMGENERIPFMNAQTEENEKAPTSGGLFLKTLGAMMLIVGLVFFGAWTLKKLGFGGNNFGKSSDAPELAILSSVSPGSGRTISVVQFGTRTLLIGSTTQTFTLLADETGRETSFDSSPTPRSVADLLAEEKTSFEEELSLANDRLLIENQHGGQS